MTTLLKVASGVTNDDRFHTMLSLHSAWLLLHALEDAVARLPETAEFEGGDYANMVGHTLKVEAQHLLQFFQKVALIDPDYVSEYVAELKNFPNTVPHFPSECDNHTQGNCK